MAMRPETFKIIFGRYEGLEKRAVEMIAEAVSEHADYTVTADCAGQITEQELAAHNLIVVGTPASNPILNQLQKQGGYSFCGQAEGYLLQVTKSIYNEEAQMILIAGADERGVLYGAVDFRAYYIPFAENSTDHVGHFCQLFGDQAMAEYERTSAPALRRRGLWTWGHVVYDYKKYIDHMLRLKMNTLILWNDYVPLNIRDVIAAAHDAGIRIYLGFSWGWNEARPGYEPKPDFADDQVLQKIKDGIIRTYDTHYADLDIDGIYFQSFTETKDTTVNGAVIAEQVVKLVNMTAEQLLEKKCALELMFGLHATSVSDKLAYIKKTDPRVIIVWEDCGAFPYAYLPWQIDEFEQTYQFTEKIARLRGDDERFGVVTKGLICLDWSVFKHQTGRFVMGRHSKEFIQKRAAEKEKLWNFVNAYWLKNADYAYKMVRLIKQANENSMITALVEDGMFEENIQFPVALFGEMMWDHDSSVDALMTAVALRRDVIC